MVYASDPEANYAQVYEFDVKDIEPQVAFPHLPENTKTVIAGSSGPAASVESI